MHDTVECSEHGQQQTTFVCQHLAASLRTDELVGFFYAGPLETRSDAWCSRCEEVRLREGGASGDWNERSEGFARITLLCGGCYDRIRERQWPNHALQRMATGGWLSRVFRALLRR